MKLVTIASTNPFIVATLHKYVDKLGYKTLILADGSRFVPLLMSASLSRVVCLDVSLPLPVLLELMQILGGVTPPPQEVAVILILPDDIALPQTVLDALQQLATPLFRFPQEIAELLDMLENLSARFPDDASP